MVKKFIVITLLILSLIIVLSSNVHASMDTIITDGDNFLSSGEDTLPINEGELETTSKYINNVLFSIGVVLAVAVGMILGIQFMVGSAEDQAKVKESLIPYVVGVFVIFAAFTIWKVAVKLGNRIVSGDNEKYVYWCERAGEWLESNDPGAQCRECGKTIRLH